MTSTTFDKIIFKCTILLFIQLLIKIITCLVWCNEQKLCCPLLHVQIFMDTVKGIGHWGPISIWNFINMLLSPFLASTLYLIWWLALTLFTLWEEVQWIKYERPHFVLCGNQNLIIGLVKGFVRILENLESPGILFWHSPRLERPGKRLLVLESFENLFNLTKKYEMYGRQKGEFTLGSWEWKN